MSPEAEVKLLERAQDALRTKSPAEALTLCDDHARRFPGVLHWNGAEILDWYLAAAKQTRANFAA